MEIIWSNEAKIDYHENIDYLLREWSGQSAIKFIDEVESILNLLESNPRLFPKSGYKNIRRAVIRKEITLFYQARESTIHIIRFWNNYQNPQSLKL